MHFICFKILGGGGKLDFGGKFLVPTPPCMKLWCIIINVLPNVEKGGEEGGVIMISWVLS